MTDSCDTFLVGVDGGGTGCRVAVGTARDGILAEASGGKANVFTAPDLAITNILTAVEVATAKAGHDPAVLRDAVAHLGLAGVLSDLQGQKIARAFPFATCTVTDDRPTAVAGALGGYDGYLAAIGTGSFVAAQRAGKVRFVGGWGFQVSDQASGAWLGRAALDRTLLCHDGVITHTGLTQAVMARFDNDPKEIVLFALRALPGDFAQFARVVVDCARQGDAIACALMDDGATYIERALLALGMGQGDRLCLIGGVGPQYRTRLPDSLTSCLVEPAHSSLFGAFELARKTSRLQRAEQI
jgi:glucosamine kinase